MELGWIDYSKDERSKIIDVLNNINKGIAIDELGIGVVRDAYANILFPGLSTLQTRPKYFLLLLYIIEDLFLGRQLNKADVLKFLNLSQDDLVEVLINNTPSRETGIIGRNNFKHKTELKSRPLSIYWTGLKTFGIINDKNLDVSTMCEIISSKTKSRHSIKQINKTSDANALLNDKDVEYTSLRGLITFKQCEYNYKKDANIFLTKSEAEYLKERILEKSKYSLLSFMIENKIDYIDSFDEFDASILPDYLREYYELALEFSEFIYGAHLYYNFIFSQMNDKQIESEFNEWQNNFDFSDFDIDLIFNKVQIFNNRNLKKFCKDFLEYANNDDREKITELIVGRERFIKGDRAKLGKPYEYAYDTTKRTHYHRLDYRFNVAKKFVDDLMEGLYNG